MHGDGKRLIFSAASDMQLRGYAPCMRRKERPRRVCPHGRGGRAAWRTNEVFEGLNVKKVCNMKKEIIRFFKMWTLPLGMFAGVGVYLMFHCIPLLSPLKVLAKGAEDFILPLMVFI